MSTRAEAQFPIYIVSKGRFERRLTADALEAMGQPYFIVVEEHEREKYEAAIDQKFGTVLVLPQRYLDDYDTFDDLGSTKSKGPGAARNFAWDHSIEQGFAWHWVMDDNIDGFHRLNRNRKIKSLTAAIFRASEDFCLRYENVAIGGLNYSFFAKRKDRIPPYVLNTRIYSCLLIRNDIPYRWRGRYNEDTDLSLRALKDGWCTVQFNAFLQNKVKTQTLKGGNTDAFYAHEGTGPKSEMLERMHPDVARVQWRFGRVHHYVNYRPFSKNKLKRKPDLQVSSEVDEYGMVLKEVAA